MLDMVLSSTRLLFAGKLFQDNRLVLRQLAIGVGVGVVATVAVGQLAPLWVATIVGGGLSGLLQPILFKKLKYA